MPSQYSQMRTLGLRTGNSLYLPLTVFLMVLLCFFLYYSSEPIQSHGQERILVKPPSTDHSQNPELKQVLKRASMSDRTVILTMVDEAWARPGSVLDVFLQSFKVGDGTRRFLNHLVIITMDAQAFGYCSSLHPHCIHPSTFVHYFAPCVQTVATIFEAKFMISGCCLMIGSTSEHIHHGKILWNP